MSDDTKKDYEALEEQYERLHAEYREKRFAVKDKARLELEALRDEYRINRLAVEKPLKAEKYRLKVRKKAKNRALNEPPSRSVLEEVGNSVTHGVGALIAIACLVLMILKAGNGTALAAAIVYGVCFVFQMLFSCLYHAFRRGTTVKRVFRRFDYSSIYLQIGGTFAPLFLVYMNDKMWGYPRGIVFFTVQWALITTGITFVAVFGPGRIRWLHFTLYFVLGWSGVLFIPYFVRNDLGLLFFILGGGLVYTLGMIPFAVLRSRKSAHFIWHFFVLLGAVVQWLGIYLYVL